MAKFYTSKDDQFSHVDGILVVKQVIKEFAEHPLNTLTTATDFFGNVLPTDHVRLSLQSPTDDRFLHQVHEYLSSCCSVC